MPQSATIPVLRGAMRVLSAIAEGRRFASIHAMARELDLSVSTCYRILKTLESGDWLRSEPEGYVLSLGLLPVAEGVQPLARVARAVRPALESLARETGLNAKASVRCGDQAVTIARWESRRPAGVAGPTGVRFTLAVGSSGSALLADAEPAEIERIVRTAPAEAFTHLGPADLRRRVAEVGRRGFCLDRGSYRPEVWSLSAPLRGRDGQVVAAISLLGFHDDFTPSACRSHLRSLRRSVLQARRLMLEEQAAPMRPAPGRRDHSTPKRSSARRSAPRPSKARRSG